MTRKLKISSLLVFSLVFLSLTSCLNVARDITNWIDINNIEDVKGAYNFLENDGIKVYLPSAFQKYSTVAYQELLDSLASKNDYQLEIKRLEHLRKMKGNFYIFFDEETRSTYTINTMPYMPLRRQDAKFVLGMISMSNKQMANKTDLEYTKITANYSDISGTQIFKAIHRIDDTKKHLTSYNSSYIVSSNQKTVYIQLLTGFEVNFDLFLQKMIL